MGIPDHLTCLLRNLYAGQESTVRTGHGTMDWFKIVKRVRQGHKVSPCLFNFYAEYIMQLAGLDESQAGIKSASSSILGTYSPGEFLFQYLIILPFRIVHGVLKARILKWFAITFSSAPLSVRPLHHDPPILGCPTGMA